MNERALRRTDTTPWQFTDRRLAERGASMVEFAVGIPVLFLLVVFLTDFAHLFLLRSTLLAGVQQGIQAAQALNGLEIDTAELTPSTNAADREKFKRYLAARQTVLNRTTELPLRLFFQPPDAPHSAVSLVGAKSESVTFGDDASALAPREGAALILPSDVATFFFEGGEIAFEHPSICGDVQDPEMRENMRKNPALMKNYCRGKIEQIKRNLGSYQRVMSNYPIIVRACGRKRLFFLGERVFCETATGFHQALSRSAIEEASELAATGRSSEPPSTPRACALSGIQCGAITQQREGSPCYAYSPSGEISNTFYNDPPRYNSAGFNCNSDDAAILRNAIPEPYWIGGPNYPSCCSGSYSITEISGTYYFMGGALFPVICRGPGIQRVYTCN